MCDILIVFQKRTLSKCSYYIKAADTLTRLYHPDKINYLILGDLCPHLHVHLVPKYQGGADWGTMFRMMPEPTRFLSPQEEARQIEGIRAALEEA